MAATDVVPVPQAEATQAAPQAPQSSSLYVGDLSAEVNEAILFEFFNVIGPVASVRVCRDAITRRSLGYAYVNFQTPADADRAIDTLNFHLIHGKPCRIMWTQRDPTLRRSAVGNIFVKGLEKSIDNKALNDAFSIFGNILSVKVVHNAEGQSVGRGFVHFQNAADAQEAIDKANGTLLKDQKITVAQFKSRQERLAESGRSEAQFKNVFVKNLTETFNETDLNNLFKQHGEITSLVLARDADNKSKGFGFVCFAEFAQAKEAVEKLNGTDANGQAIFVGRAQKKSERQAALRREYEARRKDRQQTTRGVNLYVKNLDDDVTDEKLRSIFEEFGNITSHKLMRDEKGVSKGFGFVCFDSQEEATRAITELNGRMIGTKPLYVALAQPKEERRNQLHLQYRQRLQFQRGPGGFIPQPGMFPQQMMFMNAPPAQFGQQRPFFGNPRLPTAQLSRYGAAPFPQQQFPPQQQLGPRQTRPNNYPRPQGGVPQQRGQPGRFRDQARNTQNLPQQMQQAPQIHPQGSQQLTSQLASAEPERQKQILGDNLYPLVFERYPIAAGKLTGMLLQMDNSEILHLLEDPVTLQQELEKAHEVLRQHIGPQ